MKDKSQVKTNGRAVFYAVLLESFRKAALDCGYALAIHGSMASDLDLIAVAWVEDARPVAELVKAISDCIDGTVWKDKHVICTENRFGRLLYSLSIMGDFQIDLSVFPIDNKSDEVLEIKAELKAIEFADFLLKHGCSANGFGGWNSNMDSLNANLNGNSSADIYHKCFKKRNKIL